MIEQQNVIAFRYGNNSDTDYILTLDGREIGRVYELEQAEMIEEIASRRELTTLEVLVEDQKQQIEALTERVREAEIKLKKIHKLSTML